MVSALLLAINAILGTVKLEDVCLASMVMFWRMEFAQLILILQLGTKIHFVQNGLVAPAHNAQAEPTSMFSEFVL